MQLKIFRQKRVCRHVSDQEFDWFIHKNKKDLGRCGHSAGINKQQVGHECGVLDTCTREHWFIPSCCQADLIIEFLSEITSKTQQVETGSHAGSSNATKKKPKSKKSENQVRIRCRLSCISVSKVFS